MITQKVSDGIDQLVHSESVEKLMLRTDLAYFAERILNMEVVGHHKEWSRLCANHNRICINAPRDHGKCLSGDSLVLMANGTWKKISEIRRGEYVLSDNEPRRVNHRWSSGVKPVFELKIRGGRKIKATADHKFYKNGEWIRLGDLSEGDFIWAPTRIDPICASDLSDHEVRLLAYAITEGNLSHSNFNITNSNSKIQEEIVQDIEAMGWSYALKDITIRIKNKEKLAWSKTHSPQAWARRMGIWKCRAYDKRIPKEVFSLPIDQVKLFLNRFYACDGWVSKNQIGLTLANEGLIGDIQRLLMRVGVYARKSQKTTSSGQPTFTLMIQNVTDQIEFFSEVGPIFTKEKQSDEVLQKALRVNPVNRWVKRLSKFNAEVQIESITPVGEEPVFDIEVEGKHEFVADGFKVHNSFMWCFAYAIWRAYHNWMPALGPEFKSIPRISLGYIFSNTQAQAIDHLQLIRNEVESNPKLSHLIPDKKENWSKTEVRFGNGAIIRARGWGTSVRGAHPMWVINDDVLNDEMIYSEMQRNKAIDYFMSAITPMVIPGGQIVVVGTPFHQEDLYKTLEDNAEYLFKRYQALTHDGSKALWPTRYTVDALKKRRVEVGNTRFDREYMCVPISDESSLFPEAILKQCYDKGYTMPSHMTNEDREELQVFTGVDLALSSTVGADYTVITTLGVDKFKNRWILDIRRKKGLSMTNQLREIENVYQIYKPSKILIEDNAFQRVFKDELVSRTDMPVEGFTTTARNKNDAERGVPSLQILFENRKFILPYKTDRDRKIIGNLVHELRSFSWMDGKLQGLGAHDDMVLSLWICNEAAMSSAFSFTFA
jgi:intein/homing endonuclease